MEEYITMSHYNSPIYSFDDIKKKLLYIKIVRVSCICCIVLHRICGLESSLASQSLNYLLTPVYFLNTSMK